MINKKVVAIGAVATLGIAGCSTYAYNKNKTDAAPTEEQVINELLKNNGCTDAEVSEISKSHMMDGINSTELKNSLAGTTQTCALDKYFDAIDEVSDDQRVETGLADELLDMPADFINKFLEDIDNSTVINDEGLYKIINGDKLDEMIDRVNNGENIETVYEELLEEIDNGGEVPVLDS
jgi:spore cortex formation protein SpoVR/YcgB (stage V sporulation)